MNPIVHQASAATVGALCPIDPCVHEAFISTASSQSTYINCERTHGLVVVNGFAILSNQAAHFTPAWPALVEMDSLSALVGFAVIPSHSAIFSSTPTLTVTQNALRIQRVSSPSMLEAQPTRKLLIKHSYSPDSHNSQIAR